MGRTVAQTTDISGRFRRSMRTLAWWYARGVATSRRCAAPIAALAVGLAAAMAGAVATAQDSTPRPNILVVVTDDLGWGQPGFNGGTEVGTPNLDRIANEGVKLTQFYVSPGCSPTRSALLTGRHYWKTGGVKEAATRGLDVGVLLDERLMSEALRDAGYETWAIGKWHLGTCRCSADSITATSSIRPGRPVAVRRPGQEGRGGSQSLIRTEARAMIARHCVERERARETHERPI